MQIIQAPLLKVPKKSLLVASFSTIVEWYDFTLYLFFAAVLSRVFFGEGGTSLLITLLGFSLSYLMRPIGAMFFGHIGDRFGRKTTLIITIQIMFVAMILTALLPTYSQIGIYSGVLMILLRCVMAFSVGGEYTSIVTYLLENSQKEKRGLMASLAPAFSEVGALIAVFVSAMCTQFIPMDILLSWGWRIPFIIGALLALLVFIGRHSMTESSEFLKTQTIKAPLLWTLKNFKSAIFKTFCISALGSISYYVGIGFVPVFLTKIGNFTESISLWLSTIASVAVIFITPLFGALSDKLGRKKVLVGLAIANAILPALMFYLMIGRGVEFALFGAITLAIIAAGVSAVAASATPEQFEVKNRLSGLALGVTISTAVFGGLTPLLAQYFTELSNIAYMPGIMIAVVGFLVIPVFLTLKDCK